MQFFSIALQSTPKFLKTAHHTARPPSLLLPGGEFPSSLRDLRASVIAMLGHAESILALSIRIWSLSHSGEINVKNAVHILHSLEATDPTLETADPG